jgi:uncharacterized protein (DUF2141 family)
MNPVIRNVNYFLAGAVILLLLCSRCANTQAGPSGGATDTLPPVLLKTSPPENTVNFNGKKVVLSFNEYMAVKDVSKNVVMSPPSLRRPTVNRRGKSIQVVFQDTLLPQKTYTINFGSSLADNNEGNVFPPYAFVFATGPVIDSMAFNGTVRDAYTLDPLEKITVLLQESPTDSAVYNTLPVAVAQTDAWGYFSLLNIAPGTYQMFALDDKNSNYKYDPGGNEKIAFLDSLVVPYLTVADLPVVQDIKDTAALMGRPFERLLLASSENIRRQFLSEYPQLGTRQFQLFFNQRHPVITCFSIEGIDSLDYTVEHSRFKDTLTYWLSSETIPDTLRASITYYKTDSLNQLVLTDTDLRFTLKTTEKEKETKSKEEDEPEKIPKLEPKIDFNQQQGMSQGVSIAFDALPVKTDTSKLSLFKLNAEKKTRTPEKYQWVRDTTTLRRFYVQAPWSTTSEYELEILPEAFVDIYGLANDTLIKKFSTPDPDKYCHVTFDVLNVSSQYILQVLNNKKDRVLREYLITNNTKITVDYLQAGEYCVRFVNDANANGVWDPGEVLSKKQPEKVAFLQFSETSDLLTLRENLEIEQTVDIVKLFEPPQPHIHRHNHDEHDHDHEHDRDHGTTEDIPLQDHQNHEE